MTKQESCDEISNFLAVPKTILGAGSSVDKDWLICILDELYPDMNTGGDYTKHEIFDNILMSLGADPSTEYYEGGKSHGSTITLEGINAILNLLKMWKELKILIETDETATSYDLSQIVAGDYLKQWLEESGYEVTDNMESDFTQLKPELEAYQCFNDLGILSTEHLQFCISYLGSSKSSEREDDVESKIGDASEDKPDSVALTVEIDAQLEMPDVDSLLNKIDRGVLKLNPPWQRKVVWPEKKQRQLLKSVMLKLPLPSFILFELPDSAHREVVDGKQRLTSLYNFYKGKLQFPQIDSADDRNLGSFNLKDCSEKYFSELPPEAKERIRGLTVHTSTLRGINSQTIYEIFTIYNSSGTRLNAVEIRNAAYQDHAVHKEMVDLTGEQKEASDWGAYTENLRYVIGNTKTNANRYKYLAFVERYLGYSRAFNEKRKPGFKRLTTTKSIKAFYDMVDPNDGKYAKDVREEFQRNFDFCENELNSPFHLVGKFHALKATNSLILVNLISSILKNKSMSNVDAVNILNRICEVVPPGNQNTSTIWTYHVESIDMLWNELESNQKTVMESIHGDYLDKLLPLRNEGGL